MCTKCEVGRSLLTVPTSTRDRTGPGELLLQTPRQLPSFLTHRTPSNLTRISPHLSPMKTSRTLLPGRRSNLNYRIVPPVVRRKLMQETGPSRQLSVPIPQLLTVHRLKVAAKITWALELITPENLSLPSLGTRTLRKSRLTRPLGNLPTVRMVSEHPLINLRNGAPPMQSLSNFRVRGLLLITVYPRPTLPQPKQTHISLRFYLSSVVSCNDWDRLVLDVRVSALI